MKNFWKILTLGLVVGLATFGLTACTFTDRFNEQFNENNDDATNTVLKQPSDTITNTNTPTDQKPVDPTPTPEPEPTPTPEPEPVPTPEPEPEPEPTFTLTIDNIKGSVWQADRNGKDYYLYFDANKNNYEIKYNDEIRLQGKWTLAGTQLFFVNNPALENGVDKHIFIYDAEQQTLSCSVSPYTFVFVLVNFNC